MKFEDVPDRIFEHFQRSGKAARLGPIFEDQAPGLYVLALHVTGQHEWAEDLVQTVFLRAMQQKDRDGSMPLGAWFGELLAREVEEQNFASPLAPCLSKQHDLELIPTGRDLLSEAEEAEARDHLQQCVNRLPEKYREVIRLRIEQGMTSRQAGLALGRSPATIRSQFARGLDRLRHGLSKGPRSFGVLSPAGSREPAGLTNGSCLHAARRRISEFACVLIVKCRVLPASKVPLAAKRIVAVAGTLALSTPSVTTIRRFKMATFGGSGEGIGRG
ncbi:MAG: sigma-70 family RNA polymerase sigma factor [bacterium]|nr:sigma-70 family RNA polymerase sigma factor [bacterium]